MKVTGNFLVRDIFVADKGKDGQPKTNPVDYITMVDMETGGDTKFSFDPGHGLKMGQTVQIVDATVKGRFFGNIIGYHVVNYSGAKRSA